MRRTFTKLISAILISVLLISIMPAVSFNTEAAEGNNNTVQYIRRVDEIADMDLCFGTYNGEVVEWDILGTNIDGNPNAAMLITQNVYDSIPFNEDIYNSDGEVVDIRSNIWGGSTAAQWCDSFETTAFTANELALVQTKLINDEKYTGHTIYGNVSFNAIGPYDEKVYFLSAEEYYNYQLARRDIKEDWWWLRSSFHLETIDFNTFVHSSGGVLYDAPTYPNYYFGCRPAMNLDLSDLFMISSLSDNANPDFSKVKANFTTTVAPTFDTGDVFEGTFEDSLSDLTVGYAAQTITINHPSLKEISTSAKKYNRITATISDPSNIDILYYGKINSDTNATSTSFTFPAGLNYGLYVLTIRAEIWGDKPNSARFATEQGFEVAFWVEGTVTEQMPEAEPAVNLGTNALNGFSGKIMNDNIIFGYQGNSYSVLANKTNTGEEGLFMFANTTLGSTNYGSSTNWSESDGYSWLNGYFNFNFSPEEKAAMIATTKQDAAATIETQTVLESSLTERKLFFLSAAEATSALYGLGLPENRKLGTAYWLRSPISTANLGTFPSVIGTEGELAPANGRTSYGARPAFNLDSSRVAFTTPANGSAQKGFAKVDMISNIDWKLTLQTEDTVTATGEMRAMLGGRAVVTMGSIPDGYDTATVMLLKNGVPVAYGSMTAMSNGRYSFTIPEDIDTYKYEAQFRFEKWNDGTTNLATAPYICKFDVVTTITIDTVHYDANGGEGAPARQSKYDGEAITLRTEVPTREGYTFLGWALSATATEVDYQPGESFNSATGVTLYAVWKADTYTITYDANGGENAPASQTKTHGVNLTLAGEKPNKEGYSFLGWSTSPVTTDAEYVPNHSFTTDADTTLYAVWEKEETLIIGDLNNDGYVDNVDASIILRYDAGIIDLTNLDVADVNGDGEVNNIDASLILKYDAGLISELPRK